MDALRPTSVDGADASREGAAPTPAVRRRRTDAADRGAPRPRGASTAVVAVDALRAGVAAALEARDAALEARLRAELGPALDARGDGDGAKAELRAALTLARGAGDFVTEARALVHLGRHYASHGDAASARDAWSYVLARFEERRDTLREVRDASFELAALEKAAGRYAEALVHFERYHALTLAVQGRSAEEHTLTTDLRRVNRELRAALSRLEIEALRDVLTGLPNRAAFERASASLWARAQREGRPLALALLDLDRFKGVNDTFGHAVGDETLRAVARELSVGLRATDVLARFGGEEFVLLLPDTSAAEAWAVCERLRGLVEGHDWSHVAPGLAVTVSIGLCPTAGAGSVHAMLAHADVRLYAAKHAGRNCVR